MATYVQVGNTWDYTPESAVDAGDVIVLTDIIGVAETDIAAGETGAIATKGVFEFATSVTTIAQGDACYYNASGDVITATITDVYAGRAADDYRSGKIRVDINVFSAPSGS